MRSRVFPTTPTQTVRLSHPSRSPSHSAALSPSLHLFRAYSRDRLPLTASNRLPSTVLPSSPSTPKHSLASALNAPQSPHTPTVLKLTQSEARSRKSDLSPNDLLGSKLSAFHSPAKTAVSAVTCDLEEAEARVQQAFLPVSVKLLQLLSDHTIASKHLERTLFALLILCAEVDRDIEVGGNCQVMASRAWPAVRRYLQSPGQAIQAIRRVKSGIESGKVSRKAVWKAAEVIFQVSESRLREEKGGNVGLPIYHLIRSLVEYGKVWDRLPIGSKPKNSPISPFKSAYRTLQPPESPSNSTQTTLCSTDSHPSEPAEARHAVLLHHFQRLLQEKLSKEGSCDLLEREKVLTEFRQWVKGRVEVRAETVAGFLAWLREGMYETQLQKAVKLVRLHARWEIS